MDWKTIGHAGVTSGWRGRVADAIEGRAARSRVPLGGAQARALLGLAFMGLTATYLVKVGRRLARA